MTRKTCPACGEAIESSTVRCPSCRLDGLNQIFLSQEAYDTWLRQVVKPHIAAIVPRVFAGGDHGLILTGAGNLYGIGDNSDHQISDRAFCFIDNPCLIARDVISAAATRSNTIYITRDGKVHLLGTLAKVFHGFSSAKEVYADDFTDRLWILSREGALFAIGDNRSEELEKRRIIHSKKLPALKGCQFWDHHRYHWDRSSYWTADGMLSGRYNNNTETVERKVELSSRDYDSIRMQYFPPNIEIDPNPAQGARVEVLKALYFADRRTYVEFEPIIRVTNRYILEPVPHNPDWISDTPHRCGCRPFTAQEYGSLSQTSGVKVVSSLCSVFGFTIRRALCLQADGTVQLPDGEIWDSLKQPVADLSMGFNMAMFSCRNGDVLWYRTAEEMEKGGNRISACQFQENCE